MATTAVKTRCEGCGREAESLDSHDHCAPCRVYYLAANEGAKSALVESIRRMVEAAITYEGVHPQDIRDAVEGVLSDAERNWKAAGVEFDERISELTAAWLKQTKAMPPGPVA